MSNYVILNKVWDQTGPLAEQEVNYGGVFVYCSSGSITIIINGQEFVVPETEVFDEGVINGKTFEVTGTGSWKGFLRGDKS